MPLLIDEWRLVKISALNALTSMGPAGGKAVANHFHDSDLSLRTACVIALGKMRAAGAANAEAWAVDFVNQIWQH